MCLPNSNLVCSDKSPITGDGTCQCLKPNSWDANNQNCQECINGYTKSSTGMGSPCGWYILNNAFRMF